MQVKKKISTISFPVVTEYLFPVHHKKSPHIQRMYGLKSSNKSDLQIHFYNHRFTFIC